MFELVEIILLLMYNHNTCCATQKSPTPWSPPPAGFQRLQFFRWVQMWYVTQLISISSMQQYIFIDGTNVLFNLLTNILQAAAQCAHRLKVSFFTYYSCFLLAVASIPCALTQAIHRYFFADVPWVLIMFRHDFGWEGGGAIVTMFTRYAIVDRLRADVRVKC